MAEKSVRCPNDNHSRARVVVRHCPACGGIVNADVPSRVCEQHLHADRRRQRHAFCVDCGGALRAKA